MSKEIMSKAKAHFRDIMDQELKSFYIEEWDETIYFKKGSNFAQEAKVIELQNQGKTADALIQVMINKTLDKDGKRVFTDASKAELMQSVDPSVILKVVSAINSDEHISVDDAEKN